MRLQLKRARQLGHAMSGRNDIAVSDESTATFEINVASARHCIAQIGEPWKFTNICFFSIDNFSIDSLRSTNAEISQQSAIGMISKPTSNKKAD